MAQYKANGVTNDRRSFMQCFGNSWMGADTVTPSAALALNDTLDLIRVPGGTRLTDLSIFNGDLDTGTTLQYSLGYRPAQPDGVIVASAAFFVAAGATTLQAAVAQTAPTRFAVGATGEIVFDEDVFITMTISAAATGVSGTPSIFCRAHGEAVGTK